MVVVRVRRVVIVLLLLVRVLVRVPVRVVVRQGSRYGSRGRRHAGDEQDRPGNRNAQQPGKTAIEGDGEAVLRRSEGGRKENRTRARLDSQAAVVINTGSEADSFLLLPGLAADF